MVKVVKGKEFKENIKEGIVIVDFFAKWCGPCKMVSPIFEELAGEMMGKVKFLKVDVDENMDIAGEYEVSSIPTMIVFKNGEKKGIKTGFMPKENIKEFIEKSK